MTSKNGIYYLKKDGSKIEELSIDIEVIRLLAKSVTALVSQDTSTTTVATAQSAGWSSVGLIVDALSSEGVLKNLNNKANCVPASGPETLSSTKPVSGEGPSSSPQPSEHLVGTGVCSSTNSSGPTGCTGPSGVLGSRMDPAGPSEDIKNPDIVEGSTGMTGIGQCAEPSKETLNQRVDPAGNASTTSTGPTGENIHQQFADIMQQAFANNGTCTNFSDIMSMMLHSYKK